MKRILLLLVCVAGIGLAVFLAPTGRGKPIVFEQKSDRAIFHLKDPAQIETFLTHGLKVVSSQPHPQTIVKIAGHHGPVSNLKIESPGEVFIINPDGIRIEETATLEWNAPRIESKTTQPGNAYALAIEEDGGRIRAVDLEPTAEKPTVFEYPFDEGTLRLLDK